MFINWYTDKKNQFFGGLQHQILVTDICILLPPKYYLSLKNKNKTKALTRVQNDPAIRVTDLLLTIHVYFCYSAVFNNIRVQSADVTC